MPRAGDVPAKKVDGIALGLTGFTQNEQVFSRQEGNGDHLHQLFALGNAAVHIVDHGKHFIAQAHLQVLTFF